MQREGSKTRSFGIGGWRGVEQFIERIHRRLRGEHSLHPYHLFFDTGLVVIGGFAFVFDLTVESFAAVAFTAAFVFTTVSFEFLYVPFKRRVFGIDSRSYLQDSLAYVLPVWIGGAVGLGADVAVVGDLIGLQLPLLLGFTRVGCFLGGCCYGIRTNYGIRYPDVVFEPHDGNCQSFSPGDDPEGPVFPIQLVESVVNFGLFLALYAWTVTAGVQGIILPLYLFIYAVYRIGADFFRLSSARPTWGPLSEAQVVSVGLVVALGGWFLFGL